RATEWVETIQPLFKDNCHKCHGGAKKKAGIDLRSIQSILEGSDDGPIIIPGSPDKSRLFLALHAESETHMPPKKQLAAPEIEAIREWIEHLHPGPTKTTERQEETRNPPWALPLGLRPELAIDLAIEKKWLDTQTIPTGLTDDRSYARRLYLDLVGRIPTLAEMETFLADNRSDKRRALIETLLERPEFGRHFAEIFNVVFLGREGARGKSRDERLRHGWLDYLAWTFNRNRGWDELAHDLITVEPRGEKEAPGQWFLYEKKNDHQDIARSVARSLLGKQVQCAQCHDHPVVPEIKQGHFWGLVAFFNRSVNVKTPAGPRVAEKATGGFVKYSNLEGDSAEALLSLLDGQTVAEKRPTEGDGAPDKIENYRIAPPKTILTTQKKETKKRKRNEAIEAERVFVPNVSRRERLAEWMVDYSGFHEALVNRLWATLMGRGLVHPVDQMDSVHPPSHPELLRWLGQDFARNGYDVKRLIRAITSSRAYQLDSRATSRPRPELFATGPEKPLSAEALLRSLLVARDQNPAEDGSFPGVNESELRKQFATVFPDLYAEVFSPSVREALFLTNNPTLNTLLPGTTPSSDLPIEARITELFQRLLQRAPDPEEREGALTYVQMRDGRASAFEQLAWALATGAEFRFNH
ncbi:MAG: DUF1549 domain-containing protein, partial [Verrucomicrobiota bacterium]